MHDQIDRRHFTDNDHLAPWCAAVFYSPQRSDMRRTCGGGAIPFAVKKKSALHLQKKQVECA